MAGQFGDSATFGGVTLNAPSTSGAYAVQVGGDGTVAWATQSGGTAWTRALGVTALSDGSSIIAGDFSSGTASFGSTNLAPTGSPNFNDAFVAKLDASGAFAWASKAGGSADDSAYGISALTDGSSIVTGSFRGTATFGSTTLTAASDDIFVAKVNPDGTFAWATKAGGTGSDSGYGVSTLGDGSSIVTGWFVGTATFGSTTLTAAANEDVFVAKVDASGAFVWAVKAGGAMSDYSYGVSTRPDGSSVIAGDFNGTATFGTTTLTSAGGGGDAFVAGLSASGNFDWALRAGGSAGYDYAYSAAALPDGSALVSGGFKGAADFGTTTLTSAGNYDAFSAKVDSGGTFAWASRAGGTSEDRGRGIAVRCDGSAITTGRFEGTIAFAPSSPSIGLTAPVAAASNGFVAQIGDGTGTCNSTPPDNSGGGSGAPPSGSGGAPGAEQGGESSAPVLVTALTPARQQLRVSGSGAKVTRTTTRLTYSRSGRYSFFLQSPSGRRIPMQRGSAIGTRMLRTLFCAPVVQNGVAGLSVAIATMTKGLLPAGTVLRVILRHPDGTLEGQSIRIASR